MTNQSHTELAAQARRAVKSLEILDMDSTADLLRQCAAALESPERVTKEMWKNAAENALELAQSLAIPPTAPAQDAQGELPEHCTSGHCPCIKCPRATPSPQADKQPLSDELCQTLLEAQQPFPRTISRDEFLIRNTWRACCEVYGIVTKGST